MEKKKQLEQALKDLTCGFYLQNNRRQKSKKRKKHTPSLARCRPRNLESKTRKGQALDSNALLTANAFGSRLAFDDIMAHERRCAQDVFLYCSQLNPVLNQHANVLTILI